MAERSEYVVGSKVRMTSNDEFDEGTICFVVRDDADGVPRLRPEDSRVSAYVGDDNFEVIDKYPDDSRSNSKFKVGDHIVGLPSASEAYGITRGGTHWIVADIETDGQIVVNHDDAYSDERGGGTMSVDAEHFELTNKEDNGDITMSNQISNPVAALKNVDLDEDTLTLRKYEFEDTCGEFTSRGKDAMLNQLWKEQRATFAKRLRDLEDKETPAATPSA